VWLKAPDRARGMAQRVERAVVALAEHHKAAGEPGDHLAMADDEPAGARPAPQAVGHQAAVAQPADLLVIRANKADLATQAVGDVLVSVAQPEEGHAAIDPREQP